MLPFEIPVDVAIDTLPSAGQATRSFLVGVLSSVVGTGLFVFGTALVSARFRRALTALASSLLSIDVRFVHKNGELAAKAIVSALSRARSVKIFTGRGNEFARKLYAPLLDVQTKKLRAARVLMPEVYRPPRGADWLQHRERELARIDMGFGQGTLGDQIRANIKFLRNHLHPGQLELRLFDAPHVGRIIITDDSVFFTPYQAARHGRDGPVFEYGRGELYDSFDRLFEMLWEDAKELPADEPVNAT